MSSMDQPDSLDGGRMNRKELQGPRPTPLKVRKESHKIKKPPVGPSHNQQQQPQPHQPPRQPVIIYTVSPKVIHTHSSEFMTLVQRLTGSDDTSSSSSSQYHPPSSFSINTTSNNSSSIVGGSYSSSTTAHSNNNMAAHHHVSGAISPAARFASIEKTKMHSEVKRFVGPTTEVREGDVTNIMELDHSFIRSGDDSGGGGGSEGVERTVVFPGILSPGPGSLPPISPNLFSQFFQNDPNNLINSLQQQQHEGNKSSIQGNNYMPSPFSTNLFTPSPMFSPASLDVLQRVWDS